MKKLLLYLVPLLLLITTSCSKDNDVVKHSIDVNEPISTLGAEKNSKLTIDFNSTADWNASINVEWAVLTQGNGKAGVSSISIIAREENRTGEERSGILRISASDVVKEIEFKQEAKTTVNFEKELFEVPASGETIVIKYATNITDALVQVKSDSDISWIIPVDNASRTLSQGSVSLNILENEGRNSRSANLKLVFIDNESKQEIFSSSQITINQSGSGVGTSTNYAYNKQVTVLQTHSIGNGIPLVFMGDGFIDKEIESGFYEEAVRKGIEHFFTEEPVKSLRDYFDIWMVKAVSTNNAFGTGYSTCFSCRLEGGGSTLIEGNHDRVMEFAKAVPSINMDEATCIVILNTEDYAGTCYFGFSDSQSNRILDTAVGYCPMIYGIDNDMFRRVLVHECVGHGFAKLLDEYSYQQMGRIPESEIEDNRRQQRELGWAMNVDFTSDRNSVLWKDFLEDSRYQGPDNYGETLGVYEGACTYWSGAWRPTNESMMRSNINGFNAPSRKAIYTRVMKTGIGDSWNFDLEEFIEFDLSHLPGPASRVSVSEEPSPKMFHAPIFTNMPIK